MALFNKLKEQAIDKIKEIAQDEMQKDLAKTVPIYISIGSAIVLLGIAAAKHPTTASKAADILGRDISTITIIFK